VLRGIFNFAFSVAFVTFLPAFWLAAQWWGSSDEKLLMRICMLALSPFCASIWVIVIRRKGGFLLPFAVIIGGYMVIFFLLRMRVIVF
jgi:hypothetical protein